MARRSRSLYPRSVDDSAHSPRARLVFGALFLSACGSSKAPGAPGDAGAADVAHVEPEAGSRSDARNDARSDAPRDAPEAGVTVAIDSTRVSPLPPRFSGVNSEQPMNSAEYWDTHLVAASAALAPAWVRFPSGTLSDVYDWTTGDLVSSRISSFDKEVKGSGGIVALTDLLFGIGVPLTRGKGYVKLADFVTFAKAVGAGTVVCVNGYTDTSTSAGNLATAVVATGLPVAEWELGNEPYLYPTHFASAAAYADAMKSFAEAIRAVAPSATIGLFWASPWSGGQASWNDDYATYSSPYWDAISIHLYPITSSTTPIAEAMATLSGVLAHGTGDYVAAVLAASKRPSQKVFVTEVNASGANNPISSMMFDGVFLVEYVARMSTVPGVMGVGTHVLYASNTQETGLLRATNDHDSDVKAAYKAGKTIDTSTLDFGYYPSAPGLAFQVANVAFNGSTETLATSVTGGGTVPASDPDGGAGAAIPAIHAQAYAGGVSGGAHHLVVTNKGATSETALVTLDGAPVSAMKLSVVSSSDPTLVNGPGVTTRVQIETSSASATIPIASYSVTRVDW